MFPLTTSMLSTNATNYLQQNSQKFVSKFLYLPVLTRITNSKEHIRKPYKYSMVVLEHIEEPIAVLQYIQSLACRRIRVSGRPILFCQIGPSALCSRLCPRLGQEVRAPVKCAKLTMAALGECVPRTASRLFDLR